MDSGKVIPADPVGFVAPKDEMEVEYICTLAGPRAEFLLTGAVDTGPASAGDHRDAEAILLRLCGDDPFVQGDLAGYWDAKVDAILRTAFQVVQAFAYELMRKGSFRLGSSRPSEIEAKYGVGDGGRYLSAARQASARRRLAAFHSTPGELVRAVAACGVAALRPLEFDLWQRQAVQGVRKPEADSPADNVWNDRTSLCHSGAIDGHVSPGGALEARLCGLAVTYIRRQQCRFATSMRSGPRPTLICRKG